MSPNRLVGFFSGFASLWLRLLLFAVLAGGLAACNNQSVGESQAFMEIPAPTLALMTKMDTTPASPMMIRTFKKESIFEVWKMKSDGRYGLLKSFPMCRWSGQLGPKKREGDRQVPEGFYQITPAQLNPHSHYYLSFNVGYPNAYDRAQGRTGGAIMVHGICSSAGCFSMTNEQIGEIYALAREAFSGGQKKIEMQSLPFRMEPKNLAKYRLDPNMSFWKELKTGADYFDVAQVPPQVGVCGRHYVFDKQPADATQHLEADANCPKLKGDVSVEAAVSEKQKSDGVAIATLVAAGIPAVRAVYSDGGQNAVFAGRFNDVSRPDALVAGPVEVAIAPAGKGKAANQRLAASKPAVAKPDLIGKPVAIASANPVSAPSASEVETADIARNGSLVNDAPTVAPVLAYAPPTAQPFYAKWLPWGAKPAPAPAPGPAPASAPIAVFEPATPEPANVPLPPQRGIKVGTAKPGKPAHQSVKHEAKLRIAPISSPANQLASVN